MSSPPRTNVDTQERTSHQVTIDVTLQQLFPANEGYSITPSLVQKTETSGETFEIVVLELQGPGSSWKDARESCLTRCRQLASKTRLLYGMVVTGLDVRFYRWNSYWEMVPISKPLNLRSDAEDIVERARHIKEHPFPFVYVPPRHPLGMTAEGETYQVGMYFIKGDTIKRTATYESTEEIRANFKTFHRFNVNLYGVEDPDEVGRLLGQQFGWDKHDTFTDIVNPFGDDRGLEWGYICVFDMNRDLLLVNYNTQLLSMPLEVVRTRYPYTLDDFKLEPSPWLLPPLIRTLEEEVVWEPDVRSVSPRLEALSMRLVRDFGFVWRHLLRWRTTDAVFMKLAYAAIWLSSMNFEWHDRAIPGAAPRRTSMPYVIALSVPQWVTPDARVVQVGATVFILDQDLQAGIEIARTQGLVRERLGSRQRSTVFAILTLRQIVVCRFHEGKLECSQPEELFDGEAAWEPGANLLLWAANNSSAHASKHMPQSLTSLHALPVEIQDEILGFATTSPLLAAQLGLHLDLGSPFTWMQNELPLELQELILAVDENCPVETQIFFPGAISGLAYRPGYRLSSHHFAKARVEY